MNASAPTLTRTLQTSDFLHIAPGTPLLLRAEAGTLWVTIDGEPDDIELDAGQSRGFHPHTPMIVGAIGGPARLTLAAARPSWRERLAAALGRPAWRFELV